MHAAYRTVLLTNMKHPYLSRLFTALKKPRDKGRNLYYICVSDHSLSALSQKEN